MKTTHIPHNLSTADKRQIATAICDRIADGQFLRNIAREPGMPSANSFRNWARADQHIANLYADAQELRVELFAEEILKLVDKAPATYKTAAGSVRIDPAYIAHLKLQLESRRHLTTLFTQRAKDFRTENTTPTHPNTPTPHPKNTPPPERKKSPKPQSRNLKLPLPQPPLTESNLEPKTLNQKPLLPDRDAQPTDQNIIEVEVALDQLPPAYRSAVVATFAPRAHSAPKVSPLSLHRQQAGALRGAPRETSQMLNPHS